jgi:hypothetical protein
VLFVDAARCRKLVMPASLSEIGYGAFSSCNALNSVLNEGPYPARQVQEYLYGNDNFVTSYVYTAHVGSWDPYVVEGPLAEGSAVWQGRPIRPLPNRPQASRSLWMAAAARSTVP